MEEIKTQSNICCRIFKEQLMVINQLPEEDRAKVLYLSVMNAFNQFENQTGNQIDNQTENQNETRYISISISLSSISKSILGLLSKNIVFKEYSNNYGGNRKGSGRKNKTPKNIESNQIPLINKKSKNVQQEDINTWINEINPDLKDAMNHWLEYKKERKESYKPVGLKDCIKKLNKLSNGDKDIAMAIVEQSTSNGWTGLFPLKEKNIIKNNQIKDYYEW